MEYKITLENPNPQGRVRTAFFYGTLMAPAVLNRVCHGSAQTSTPNLSVRPAILHNFRRHKVRNVDYPAIIRSPPSTDPDATVRGTLVTPLTSADIFRLDIFEGDQYERQLVKVRPLVEVGDESGEGNVEGEEEVEAETYVWIAGERHLEMGEEWDYGEFVREKIGRWVGTSEEYEEVDEAVRAEGDDPTGGRGLNGSITRTLEEGQKKDKEEVLKSAV
ncbi:hypothetical protein K402DRAFT_389357 [Aulographum hederae CBS 113979]|uniref:Putative gamma-glutamylcyclotransferase n=1 Tax=Aulographum hederae CBS 113979 TaxID=1176131 RepID=A0A6G1HDQ8_9PEZI|nr:hypothetical protein K402DRAFT_389357 [Aulographum hederae CBS 113979]